MTILGKRLNALKVMILEGHDEYQYSDIWDGCCDHGYLGISLLESFQTKAHPTVHFVDQVEHITTSLSDLLKRRDHIGYEVHTQDVATISFTDTRNHCVILSGVTSNGIIRIIKELEEQQRQKLDFILCPTRGIYDLRAYLIDQKFYCLAENHVCENQRHYEMLHVRSKQRSRNISAPLVSSIGAFWEKTEDLQLYLKKRIEHHQKEATHLGSSKALQAYQRKWQELNFQ